VEFLDRIGGDCCTKDIMKYIFTLFLVITFVLEEQMPAQYYDYVRQNALESMQPKEQLMIVDKIGMCGNDTDKRAFWWKKSYINCYELLRNFDHGLKRDDVDRGSVEDIRKWYYNALRASGLTFSEAKAKASGLITD
jgi:hypothetical protein